MEIADDLLNITDRFTLFGPVIGATPYGEGHIHDTFLVQTAHHSPDYILQRINRNIFHNIPAMMRNMETVTSHLRIQISGFTGHDPDREILTLVKTKEGDLFYEDGQGDCWRMFIFIKDTLTHQQLPDISLAWEAGRAIGRFQALLADLNRPLEVTIPGFHDIGFRIRQFEQALDADPLHRATSVADELRFAKARFSRMKAYFTALNKRAVTRVTHNDTKLNNILFDAKGRAVCIIDLDTVMPGFIHFDYGDAIRTLANSAAEDERDLSKVIFNLDVHREFTRGFLEFAETFLTEPERKLLPYAPVYLTFLIGLRFITDYLDGDRYFKVHYPDHNRVRARAQFRLISEMEKALPFMKRGKG